jgi:hypothetical protein
LFLTNDRDRIDYTIAIALIRLPFSYSFTPNVNIHQPETGSLVEVGFGFDLVQAQM